MATWVLFCALLLPQQRGPRGLHSDLEGFQGAVTHTLVFVDDPILVQSVEGRVMEFRGPLPYAWFEIRGPGSDKHIRRAITSEDGKIRIKHVSSGAYTFLATREGFVSYTGMLIISRKAPAANQIKIEMEPDSKNSLRSLV
jgi:hypothetical protein